MTNSTKPDVGGNPWSDENYTLRMAKQTGLPVFPVKITRDVKTGKFNKVPLTENGLWDATTEPDTLSWQTANGYGIRTGDGLYVIDVDDPAEDSAATAWVRSNLKDFKQTRVHKTPSGGFHIIFRLPAGWEDLRTRQNVVPGLDTRGHGGFIAYGEGYSLLIDKPLSTLTTPVCEQLDKGGEQGGVVKIRDYKVFSTEEVPEIDRRIAAAIQRDRHLARRWAGDRGRPRVVDGVLTQPDTTASAMDQSVAALLALAGFTYDEIIYALYVPFKHGQAHGGKKSGYVLDRAIKRCAARATDAQQAREANAMKLLEAQSRQAHDPEKIMKLMGLGK